MTSNFLADPVLVGREREIEELQHHLDLALQGKGSTVFVSGEAGSGKTRLVNEFLIAAKQKKEITQLAGWCLNNSGIPYFPFIEAFNAYSSGANKKSEPSNIRQGILHESTEAGLLAGEEELGLRAWLMGPAKIEKTQELESLSPQAWKDSTFAAVTNFLLSISAKKPTILFIDDLHWADTASLALLQYISRFIIAQKVVVLGTFRSEDLNPDSEDHPHPLVDTLRLMGRESLCKEIELPSLNLSHVSLLAENMVGGRVQTELVKKLSEDSQGNPLFIVESLKMLSEKGSLVQENDKWRLSTDEVGIPTKIKDILLRRADALKPNQRRILDIASVIGSKFDPELLGEVASMDSLETLETLGAIEKSTSLVVGEGSFYRFDHAKCKDALYEEISLPLRRAYHSRVAQRLETIQKAEKLPVGDLAFHYAQAGNKEKAIKYALVAGEEALKIYSGAEAIKYYKYVLDATADDNGYAKEKETALEGLGDGLFARGRCREALNVFEQLSDTTTFSLVKSRALRKAIDASFFLGNYSHAMEIVNKIVEDPKFDRLERARVRFFKAKTKAWGGQFKENLQTMEESLRVFEAEHSFQDIHDALAEITTTYVSVDKLENAIASGLRSLALSDYSRSAGIGANVNAWLSLIYFLTKLEEEGLQALEESFKASKKISDPISRASLDTVAYWLSGQLIEAKAASKLFSGLPLDSMRSFGTGAKLKFFMSSFISGALREFKQGLKAAVAQSLKGAECAEETDGAVYQTFNYGNLVREYSALGDKEQAEKYLQKLAKIFDETSVSGIFHSRAAYASVKAAYFSSKGQWKEANQFHEEAIKIYLSGSTGGVMAVAGERQGYCWTLLQQGRFADAKLQFEKAKETMDSLDRRFASSNILGHLIAPLMIEVDKEFNMRLDLINVAKTPGVLFRVESLIPDGFKVTSMQPNFRVENGSLEFDNKEIDPFQDQAVTFTVQATKIGEFTLAPQLVFVDDLGETRFCKVDPVNIAIKPTKSNSSEIV